MGFANEVGIDLGTANVLIYIKGKGIETEVKTVLSNSLGFGGHNATLLVKKFS